MTDSLWYACYTRARHEKRVEQRLSAAGFTTFLPSFDLERKWHDRKRIVRWPLFPGYVFVSSRFDLLARVAQTPGLVSIVQNAGRPCAIADDEIANIRRFADVLDAPTSLPELAPLIKGQEVRIKSGPFAGVQGTVVQLRGRNRAVVLVGLHALGCGVRVELEMGDVDLPKERRRSLEPARRRSATERARRTT